jgi:NAD(P)-dependent dehydrogenase (short-subunit alcohol dehydrogenase family)
MGVLTGRHAVITGGGKGIGAAITDKFLQEGAHVTIMSRDLKVLREKADEYDYCFAVKCDVTDEKSVREAFEQARDAHGPIDILVNNAGQAVSVPFKRTSLSDFQAMLDVNLTGPFMCIQNVLEGMVSRGNGRIINIASTAALKGYSYVAAYTAAKHGLLGLTRSLALEVAPLGVTVNCICPGFTDTEIARKAVKNIMEKTGRSEQEAVAELAQYNPQKRFISPEEIADTALWVADEKSSSINGQAISVAGGEI